MKHESATTLDSKQSVPQMNNIFNLLFMFMNDYVQFPEMTLVVPWRYIKKLN